ncbi:hypothetical protein ACJJTC_004019 [Scirpophaga incertulas]
MRVIKAIINYFKFPTRMISNEVIHNKGRKSFETVFLLPSIRYISIINRLKVYQMIGTGIAIPSSGILEMACVFPDQTFVATSYIGLTATALLSIATLPFRNIIGFLYISDDNKSIKISCVDFWGKRKDKIIDVEDWIPLLDIAPKPLDAIYLSPKLVDGTSYKLLIRYGKILNHSKISQVLE